VSSKKTYTVVLDVMGADSGADEIAQGGIDAARQIGDSLKVVLVGNETLIRKKLEKEETPPENVTIAHAPEMVTMDMAATDGARLRNSSIAVGMQLLKDGKADAFVSPGNTGAVMATALLRIGRIPGVSRPAITSLFPTSIGRPTVVLDVGANADCKPQHLSQFAVMGSVYAQIMMQSEAPRVGLISIGEERSKGNELIFSARNLISDTNVNFVGNIEGRDILSGAVEVAVTDGFTGNILLKFAESIQPMLASAVKRQVDTNVFSRFGVMMMLPFVRRMRDTFDYAVAGGAPLLGIEGIVLICHGASSPKAIRNAILAAYKMARQKIMARLHEELLTNHFGPDNDAKNKGADFGNGVICTASPDDKR